MQEKVRNVALIGAGTMAEYHIRGFRSAGADVLAIVDKNLAAGRAFAAKWSIHGGVYADLAGLQRAHPETQAVSVITPNKFHHPLVLDALRRGLHVFCEKPPALTAAQTIEMAEVACAAGKTLQFDLNNRARLDAQFIKKRIIAGEIGRINSAQAVWMRRTGIPGFGTWFTSKAMAGGGPLIDLLHMIDLALWFMGYPEPEFVLAQTFADFINDPDFSGSWGKAAADARGRNDVESACHGFVRFKTGQVLSFHNSWAEMVKAEDTYVTLQGSAGGAHIRSINELNSCELYAEKEGVSHDQSFRFQNDLDMGRTRAPANFIAALNGEAEPLTRPDEAVKLMKLIDAAYQSAAEGRPVTC
jgi:predicted dehydrogenase